jgi:hypothetical protein
MKLLTLDQLKDVNLLFDFCIAASLETNQPAASNMWHSNWSEYSHTLPYLLFNGSRFSAPTGEFFLLEDNGKIVGCSGVYTSEFSNDIAVAGCRMWIAAGYRNQSLAREYFLPAQKAWAVENKFKSIALTFNEYNKNIKEIWRRSRLGENRSPREPRHIFYDNFNELKFLVNVQHTPQWIIYETLDPTWNFDWESIKF